MLMEQSGGAGHSIEIAKALDNTGFLIGIDRDIEAINVAKNKLSNYTNIKYVHKNHDEIKEILEEMQIDAVDRYTVRFRSIFISIRQ